MAIFKLKRLAPAAIERQIEAARNLPADGPGLPALPGSANPQRHAAGFRRDSSRSLLGRGEPMFLAAKRAFKRWAPFDLGWVRVANPAALIVPGQIVAVEARTLGLWTMNLSRIVEVTDVACMFGFLYSTTERHVEQGEERFVLHYDAATGDVWYELEAVSRPRAPLARLGYPVTRAFQHRFARDSHRRMKESVSSQLGG
jgi:uncharacterized protein (UPF0548 family)